MVSQIKVGSLVKDKISLFKGHSIARCVYLNGCVQHEVQASADKDNKMQPNLWIDEEQLEDLTPMFKPKTKQKRKYVIKDIEDYKASRRTGGGHRGHR